MKLKSKEDIKNFIGIERSQKEVMDNVNLTVFWKLLHSGEYEYIHEREGKLVRVFRSCNNIAIILQ